MDIETTVTHKKAIILPYVVGQNEPSKPENVLLNIPQTNVKERDDLLFAEFVKYFDYEPSYPGHDLRVEEDTPYGDLYIGDGECFLFYTYINV